MPQGSDNPVTMGRRVCIDVSPEKTYPWPGGHVTGCPASVAVGEVKVKTSARYPFSALRRLESNVKARWKKKKKKGKKEKRQPIASAGEDVEKRKLLHCWWD